MTNEELEKAIESIKNLKRYVDEMEADPKPNLCGVCLRPLGNSSMMFMPEDVPYQTSHHVNCGRLIAHKYRTNLLADLYHQSSGLRKRWLKRLLNKEQIKFTTAYLYATLGDDIEVSYSCFDYRRRGVGNKEYNRIRREVIEDLIAQKRAPQKLIEYWEKCKDIEEEEYMD